MQLELSKLMALQTESAQVIVKQLKCCNDIEEKKREIELDIGNIIQQQKKDQASLQTLKA
ncbi:hypothetical protein [Pectobacterium polonicum]|nr:hypothetical protein [Pectobacterium polonicum]